MSFLKTQRKKRSMKSVKKFSKKHKKNIKRTLKAIAKYEKRKKELIDMFREDKIPKGITKRDIMASLKGYNISIGACQKTLDEDFIKR